MISLSLEMSLHVTAKQEVHNLGYKSQIMFHVTENRQEDFLQYADPT